MNTSNLQPNMVSPTQQAAHTIFEVTGKQKAMKTIKSLLKKNDDPYIALMICVLHHFLMDFYLQNF